MDYTIKEIADLTNVTIRTLHYYDEINLLNPSRLEKGNRIYSDNEILLMNCITFYKQLGLPLNDIKSLLKNKTGKESLLNILNKQLKQLEAENNEQENILKQINLISESISSEDNAFTVITLLDCHDEHKSKSSLNIIERILIAPFHKRLTYALIIIDIIIWIAVIAWLFDFINLNFFN